VRDVVKSYFDKKLRLTEKASGPTPVALIKTPEALGNPSMKTPEALLKQ
jgi:hypothetical protein